ncbi:hypothetical protein [Aliikangiella sp. IMCC44359]|uniref:hypothetical protein n=1 Tax=Aliikangiella sp. IMCC44359 TaxID=3459125 RepID=UPI00403AD4EF
MNDDRERVLFGRDGNPVRGRWGAAAPAAPAAAPALRVATAHVFQAPPDAGGYALVRPVLADMRSSTINTVHTEVRFGPSSLHPGDKEN